MFRDVFVKIFDFCRAFLKIDGFPGTRSKGAPATLGLKSISGTHILTENLISNLQKTSPDQKPRVVIVSSGGMLTQKLDLSDLNSEKGTFDGTMVYAQQKRQQVIMTEQYAEQHPDIFWASMHPG